VTPALLLLVAGTVAVALALRPWRAVAASGPPWPWLACWSLLPLLWGLDRHTAVPLVPLLSAAPLLVLLAGWPLALLAMLPAALLTAWLGGLDAAEALHRLVWLGIVPATAALALGAASRRWLPHHAFVYILGRGFLVTFAAAALAGIGLGGPGRAASGDALVAGVLAAFSEAFVTGMLTAVLVAFRPQWLATYADRLYLRPPG
jgi:uncharacterized membrane protein